MSYHQAANSPNILRQSSRVVAPALAQSTPAHRLAHIAGDLVKTLDTSEKEKTDLNYDITSASDNSRKLMGQSMDLRSSKSMVKSTEEGVVALGDYGPRLTLLNNVRDYYNELLGAQSAEITTVQDLRYYPASPEEQGFFERFVGAITEGEGYDLTQIHVVVQGLVEDIGAEQEGHRVTVSNLHEQKEAFDAQLQGQMAKVVVANNQKQIASEETEQKQKVIDALRKDNQELDHDSKALSELQPLYDALVTSHNSLDIDHKALKASSDDHMQGLAQTKKEADQLKAELEEKQQEVGVLVDQVAGEQQRVRDVEQESDEKLATAANRLQQELDTMTRTRDETLQELEQTRLRVTASLSTILISGLTGESIPTPLLGEVLNDTIPLLAQPSNLKTSLDTQRHRLAAGGITGPAPFPDTSLFDVQLLALIRDVDKTARIQQMSFLVWLDQVLLEQLWVQTSVSSGVMLAWAVVLTCIGRLETANWLERCLCLTMLTDLADRFPFTDQPSWLEQVRTITSQHPQLSDDVLGQACLARLASTTMDPDTLLQTYALAEVEPSETLVEGVAHQYPDRVGVANTESRQVVLIGLDGLPELIFDRYPSGLWRCSTTPPVFTSTVENQFTMTWDLESFHWTASSQPSLHAFLQKNHRAELRSAEQGRIVAGFAMLTAEHKKFNDEVVIDF